MQGRAGRAFGNGDFLQRGIVRLKKAFARAVHADAAGNQIRLARQDVTVALDARNPARLFQFAKRALQFLLAVRRQVKQPEQFRHIGRNIISLSKQPDDLVFHHDSISRQMQKGLTELHQLTRTILAEAGERTLQQGDSSLL